MTLLCDKYKDKEMSSVVSAIFSHASVAKKNQLAIMLVVSVLYDNDCVTTSTGAPSRNGSWKPLDSRMDN